MVNPLADLVGHTVSQVQHITKIMSPVSWSLCHDMVLTIIEAAISEPQSAVPRSSKLFLVIYYV